MCNLLAVPTWLTNLWPHLTALLSISMSLFATAHVVLYKRDTRAAIGWMGVIWLTPLLGSLLYLLLGINRIHRKAHFLRRVAGPKSRQSADGARRPLALGADHGESMQALERVVDEITKRPLLRGNQIVPLVDGDETFPAMLAEIEAARESICLCSYIFNNDRAGQQFVAALGRAVERGVEARVIVDAIGARYAFPSIVRPLRNVGVRVERFLPTLVPGWFAYANLRSHRKIMVADGRIGFTGGMNIREGAWAELKPSHPLHDLHFRLAGPVVGQLQEVFADDWLFCTREEMQGPRWFPPIEPAGVVAARGISDGPDEDLGKLRLTLLGAISCARKSIAICTPYFLPDEALVSALNVAAMRGVSVDILLPGENNLATVQWASTAMLWQVLGHGCRVWLAPPPFDHTKLMVVDSVWTLVGSGNWDPRSLRLNFEFNVECYDILLAEQMQRLFCQRVAKAQAVTLADVDGRRLPVKLRDGIARLFTPYL